MPNPRGVDHTGKTIGPFVVVERGTRKRHWKLRCSVGHTCQRRIDILLRTREESLHCTDCRRSKPLDATEMTEAFRTFCTTLSPIQRNALGRLLTFADELAR